MNRNEWIKLSVVTVVLVAVIRSCSPFVGMNSVLIGQEAPGFTLPALNGGETSLNTVRQGRPAILFFWATWCPHCREELTELSRLHQEMKNSGIAVILIDLGESEETVAQYVRKNNIPFRVFLDAEAQTAKTYRIVGVPTFFVIDRNGIVTRVSHQFPENYRVLLGLVS